MLQINDAAMHATSVICDNALKLARRCGCLITGNANVIIQLDFIWSQSKNSRKQDSNIWNFKNCTLIKLIPMSEPMLLYPSLTEVVFNWLHHLITFKGVSIQPSLDRFYGVMPTTLLVNKH